MSVIAPALANAALDEPGGALDQHNVTWTSPRTNPHGSMPLGNGDLAANVWCTADGSIHIERGTLHSLRVTPHSRRDDVELPAWVGTRAGP